MNFEFDLPIWISSKAVDFRKGPDGLCAVVSDHFKLNPQKGIYVFYNKARNRLKVLFWHVNGFVIIYKRLESGKFTVVMNEKKSAVTLDNKHLDWLIKGLDWQAFSRWKKLEFESYL